MTRKTDAQKRLNQALDDIGKVKGLLTEVYKPEASREDLATVVGDALDVIDEYDSDSEEEED